MKNSVINSWEENASEWVRVIDEKQIASRQFTDSAIIQMIAETPANKVLDLGCGEGWLTRKLTNMGKEAVGIDATFELLENARQKGPETYCQMSFEDIIHGSPVLGGPYDLAVFNFCLYQKDGISALFDQIKKVLSKKGCIIIQTLHPYFLVQNGLKYEGQIIHDSWKGLPGNFTNGHEWYARTFEDWQSVFVESDMQIIALREVVNEDGKPISLIIKAGGNN